MKGKKGGLFLKVALIGILVAALFMLNRVSEGFQSNSVDLYFTLDNTVPKLVSSSNPGVTLVSADKGGKAVLNIPASMPALSEFSGMGWSQKGAWVALPPTKLEKISNALALQTMVSNQMKTLRLKTNKPVLKTEAMLPQKVTSLTMMGLDTATFGLGSNAGDPKNNQAKIMVKLMF